MTARETQNNSHFFVSPTLGLGTHRRMTVGFPTLNFRTSDNIFFRGVEFATYEQGTGASLFHFPEQSA